MESLLRRLLGERISAEVPLQLTPLVGDASTRRYSRLRAGDTPFIVMELGERGGAEEYGSLPDDPGEPAFLAVQQHLAQAGLPVPELYGYDGEARVLVLEDLGDVTLAARSQATSLEAARPLYEEAIDLIVALQGPGTRTLDPTHRVARTHFDVPTLRWEFDHFIEFGLERPLSPSDAQAVARHWEAICHELASGPQVLVHRDFHARNLMVKADGHLGLIDFQDALIGPPTYDLVSLLRDAYVELPEDMVWTLVERYRIGLGAQAPSAETLRRRFHLCALHRCLKAAGRFAFLDQVKGKPAYRADIPAALAGARKSLSAVEELGPLWTLLGHYAPGLAP